MKSERNAAQGDIRKNGVSEPRTGLFTKRPYEALRTCDDFDKALKPWERTLTNKERSIILKEQLGWERAYEIFNWFRKKGCYEINVIHCNIMLRILGRAQRWTELKNLWDDMRGRRVEPVNSTYGTLIDVHCKACRLDEAMEWVDLMYQNRMEPDEVTMGIVIQMYKKAGDFKKAEEFFKKWETVNGRRPHESISSPLCLSSYTYNNLIDTYGKAGKVKEASEAFERMLDEGLSPTTVTFNTMIHLYGNNNRMEEVWSLMQKMEDLGCYPDTRTYNILIFLHAKHNDIETASFYFEVMKSASLEPDIVSYRTLLYAFSIRQMVSEADMLVLEMDEKGMEIDEYTQSALTRMYLVAGMLERSWSWFHRFHLSGRMTPECYSANIDAFGEHGHVWEAEKVFYCCREKKIIHFPGSKRALTVLEFNVMIKAYGISKKYNEACLLFDSIQKHNISPDKCSYGSIIQILASANLPVRAKRYLTEMQGAGLVDDCIPHTAIISSFIKTGQLEKAVSLYTEMIGFDIQPDPVVYGVLINAFAEIGSVRGVNFYLNEMRKNGLEANSAIYNSLIKIYSKVGFLKDAEEIYRAFLSFEDGPDTYSSNCMINLYSSRSMIGRAEEVFDGLRRKGCANEFSYAMMLCMYRRNGMFDEAVQMAKEMREKELLNDVLSYNNVIGLYAAVGRFRDAMITFKDMLVSSSSVRPDGFTFKSLGVILVKCGVSKEDVKRLREKGDDQNGVSLWISMLSSVIGFCDDDDDDDKDDDYHAVFGER
ncbi:unnamed protein product [Cuscuta campestris]|uniref:Pentacotripeptide-repeat region of PRORP domain-containing protein n=1 Tax=Cuscuta campestris TaxID=132261 RepID=A0A484NQ29_9ASTE|nr:unnamed protein product [Cuscuta campestris]